MSSKLEMAHLIKGKDHKILNKGLVLVEPHKDAKEYNVCTRGGQVLGILPKALWNACNGDPEKVKEFMRAPDAKVRDDSPEKEKPEEEHKKGVKVEKHKKFLD